MRYRQKRTYCWSPNIAYSVGLMASDGCLQSDGRHLDLTSIDTEQLDNFRISIGRPELPISDKLSGLKLPAFRVQFSDVSYYDFLLQTRLTPAKSKTMPALKIPLNFYSHFLRGLFDGDGSSNAYFDPRWRSSYMFYVSYTSASKQFLEYLSVTNQKLYGLCGSSIRLQKGAYSLVYAKADAQLLYTAMYTDAELFLSRKKTKLENFISIDKNVTLSRLNARVVKW